jgi:ribose 1,5-bisphosphokinase
VSESRSGLGPGVFVPVVGPSGAGKDTLIRLVAGTFDGDPRVRFVRRLVTRPSDSATEDHDSIDEAEFVRLTEAGGVALHWRAHGLGYAIPLVVDDWIAEGAIAIANLSRKAIEDAARRYRNVTVVNVTAPADILRARLQDRGRESGADIEERLTPVPVSVPDGVAVIEIVNDKKPEDAARLLADAIAQRIWLRRGL